MTYAIFSTKNSDYQAQSIASILRSDLFPKLEDGEYEIEVIEHKLDLQIPSNEQEFFLGKEKYEKIIKIKFHFGPHEISSYFIIKKGFLETQYISQIIYRMNIDYSSPNKNILPINILFENSEFKINSNSERFSEFLLGNKIFKQILGQFFVTKTVLDGYELKQQRLLYMDYDNITISNLPIILKNRTVEFHADRTIKFISLFIKTLKSWQG